MLQSGKRWEKTKPNFSLFRPLSMHTKQHALDLTGDDWATFSFFKIIDALRDLADIDMT